MKRYLACVVIFASIIAVAPQSASAQLPGNPVYAVTPQAGITLSADYGRGFPGDESPNTDFFGGRILVGFPALSFWIGGGSYDSRTDTRKQELGLGGGLAVNFLKASSLPVALSLQVGGGFLQCGDGCTTINAVAGPALKINVVGAVNIVQPWLMPRVQVTRFSMSGASVNQLGFGGSAGVNINLPFGLGFHGAADFSMFKEATSGAIVAEKRSPLVIGGGLHYSVRVPGFGVL